MLEYHWHAFKVLITITSEEERMQLDVVSTVGQRIEVTVISLRLHVVNDVLNY